MENQEKPKSVKLEIELHEDGKLSVQCPMIADTLFMCGLIEMAKAVVFQYKANQANIVRPQGGIMNFVRNRLK